MDENNPGFKGNLAGGNDLTPFVPSTPSASGTQLRPEYIDSKTAKTLLFKRF